METDLSNRAQAPLRVLVADDEKPMRLLYRVNLEAEGMTVIEAADGAEAVSLAIAEQPDVALLDLGMPRLDGWQVAARLRANAATAHTTVIFVSASRGLEIERRLRDSGALFIAKPFEPLELPRFVRRAAEKQR